MLEERLNEDLKDAMRNRDNVRKLALRAVKTAITEAKVSGDQSRDLSDEDVLAIIMKQAKQRRDSAAEYAKGGRDDLVATEEAELSVLEAYLPKQLSEDEVREHARAAIAELGVSGMTGMGPVMRKLTGDLRGRADGKMINGIVRELLAS